MSNYSTNEFKAGLKILIDGDPYAIVENEMVKPGKGQAFNRVRVRNLKTGRTIERTWKSGDTVEAADVVDTDMQGRPVVEGWHRLRGYIVERRTVAGDAARTHGTQGNRDRPGRAGRHRHRWVEAGEA